MVNIPRTMGYKALDLLDTKSGDLGIYKFVSVASNSAISIIYSVLARSPHPKDLSVSIC